jgi:hypothetical protein
MRRLLAPLVMLPLLTVVVVLTPARAAAVTLQEIIELTRAGVSDEVLIALIEVDRRVFPVDPETLSKLKKAGVSERVMVAIVKSGRTPIPEPVVSEAAPRVPADPQVIVVEREPPVVREVVVPVPVYVAVGTRSRTRHRDLSITSAASPYIQPFVRHHVQSLDRPIVWATDTPPDKSRKAAEPVYWGWGGKLRPDAWKPK